jgi:hypothetical protein
MKSQEIICSYSRSTVPYFRFAVFSEIEMAKTKGSSIEYALFIITMKFSCGKIQISARITLRNFLSPNLHCKVVATVINKEL